MRNILPFLGIAVLATGVVAWKHLEGNGATGSPSSLIQIGGMTMGGTWSLKLPAIAGNETPEQLQTHIAKVLEDLEEQLSTYRESSNVSRFNHYRGTDWFAVPKETAEVIVIARKVSEETDGAFDITIAPLVDLWGFGPRRKSAGVTQTFSMPTDLEIAKAKAHVNFRHLEIRLEPPALRKSDAELTIDLGGIGKGFAADRVSTLLDQLGQKDYLIAIGGELRAQGRSVNNWPWRVGIETPTADIRRIFRELQLRNGSLSTSGDYRNFVERDGRRFCHEINPATGRPIHSVLASVSVVHASGAYADAIATALIVRDPEDGFALAARLNLKALFISRGDGKFDTRATSAFEADNSTFTARGISGD
jgi:thiamine biosynthesis lipoprotein